MGSLVFGAIWAGKATHTLAEYLKHAEECRRLVELTQAWERLAAVRQKDITPNDIEIPPESKL